MTEDEQYKTATKAVDDAMRTDVLGPNMVKVLTTHTPASDAVQSVIARAITDDPDAKNVKQALEQFLKNYDKKRKGVWVDRAMWTFVGAVAVGIVTLLVNILTKPEK